jgi:hypothetical protein
LASCPLLVATDGAIAPFGRDGRPPPPTALERDPGVLKTIGRRFGGRLALDARVVRPGVVRVGDPVELRVAVSSGRGELG